jgi:hypothetical protein
MGSTIEETTKDTELKTSLLHGKRRREEGSAGAGESVGGHGGAGDTDKSQTQKKHRKKTTDGPTHRYSSWCRAGDEAADGWGNVCHKFFEWMAGFDFCLVKKMQQSFSYGS